MNKKKKIIITHNLVSRLFFNGEKETNLFNKLDLFAPKQMKLKVETKLNKYKGEKKEKLERKVKKLYKLITFISFSAKENEMDIYELYHKVLKKVKARWIWDVYKYKKEGSAPIPYIDSDSILESLEEKKEEKEEKVFLSKIEEQRNDQFKLISKEKWDKKDFSDIEGFDDVEGFGELDFFHFVNNYLYHNGLLCLSDGKRYYLKEGITNENKKKKTKELDEKKLEFPKLNNKDNMEIWYIQRPHKKDKYIEVIVEKRKNIIKNYWEFFTEYNSRFEKYYHPQEEFEIKNQYLISLEEEIILQIAEGRDYEFLKISEALEKCHIPNKNNNHGIDYFDKYKSFFEKYQQIFQEYGEIIIIGDITYLSSELHLILNSLQFKLHDYEECQNEYEKYEKIKFDEDEDEDENKK